MFRGQLPTMRSPVNFICLAIFLSFCLAGCGTSETNAVPEDIAAFFPFEDVNQTITLSLFLNCPDAKLEIGATFCYLVTNESQDTVRFPPTLNLRLYSFDESSGNWNVVQDSFKVSGNDIVLNPKGQEFWDLVNSVHPVLEPSSKPVKIRIIVVGEVEGNDKKPVGAYLDVILKPEGVNAQFYLLHETEIYAEKTVIPHVVRLIGSAS